MSIVIINNSLYVLSLNFGEKSDYMGGGRIMDPYKEVRVALEGTRRLDAGDHVNGTFEANESAVEFYFIHKEDYPKGADLDPTLSIYQAYSIRGRFELDISRSGGWLFVIINNYNETQLVRYEMSIRSVPIGSIVIQTTLYGATAAVLIGVTVYVFQRRESFREKKLQDPRLVGLLMGVVSLIVPYGFIYHPSFRAPELHLSAVIWALSFYTTYWHFTVANLLDPWLYMGPTMLIVLWVIGIRILFPYQIMRYFQRKTTKVRMLAVGVLAELPMVPQILLLKLYEAILIAIGVDASIGIGFPIPIPCMLVISLLLLRFVPISSEPVKELKSDTRKLWIKTSLDSI